MPVDLLRVAPRVFGSLDVPQVASLGAAGVCAMSSLAGGLPAPVGFTLAALGLAYGLLEVEGLPLRRLAPQLIRFLIRTVHDRRSNGDDALWLEASIPGPKGPRNRLRPGAR